MKVVGFLGINSRGSFPYSLINTSTYLVVAGCDCTNQPFFANARMTTMTIPAIRRSMATCWDVPPPSIKSDNGHYILLSLILVRGLLLVEGVYQLLCSRPQVDRSNVLF